MSKQILYQGAEAIITKEDNKIIKNRIEKSYRIKELDERLRKTRTKSEAKILEKAQSIINVPKMFKQDKFSLELEFIKGEKLSETLNSYSEEEQLKIMRKIAEQVEKMHRADIIHGDLTTSNMILVRENKENELSNATEKKQSKFNQAQSSATSSTTIQTKSDALIHNQFKIYFIDFGLGFISKRDEDKAVDLHLIKQALEAKHWKNHKELFSEFLKHYHLEDVQERLKKVELRGRYKH
jgi:TP53 regulating kinase-like protein